MKIYLTPEQPIEPDDILRKKVAALLRRNAEGYLIIDTENSLDAITWILACMHCRAVAVPINSQLKNIAPVLAQLPPANKYFSREIDWNNEGSAEIALRDENEICAVLFSSGSSGNPKALAFTLRALNQAANAHKKHLNFLGTWLLNMPLFHVGGFSVVSRAFFLNQNIAVDSQMKFDPQSVWTWIRSGIVQGISLVPTMLHRILEETNEKNYMLTHVLIGGAGMADDLLKKAISRGFPILRTYGSTEACSQIATEISPNTGMKPLPGLEIKIAADREILLKSPFSAVGKYEFGKLLPISNEDGFIHTGDLGQYEECLEILGRKTDLIISGGLNIFPAEIENCFIGDDILMDVAVASIDDSTWGEVVCAAYVTKRPVQEDLLKDFLVQRIDKRKIPKNWIQLNEIPRTPTGKIDRNSLKKIFQKHFSS